MYITIENEVITGVYCGTKQEGFIEVPDSFDGFVGSSVNDFDSNWNLIPVEPEVEIMAEPYIPLTLIQEIEAGIVKPPKGEMLKDGRIYQMSLVEKIEAGFEELPVGWKITGDRITEMNSIEKIQAGLEQAPEGYEIIGDQLIEIMTPEKLNAIERMELLSYLASTDWYATRMAETGKAIPDEIITARQAARDRISELKANT